MAQKVRIRKTRTVRTLKRKNGKAKGILVRKPKVKRKVTIRRR